MASKGFQRRLCLVAIAGAMASSSCGTDEPAGGPTAGDRPLFVDRAAELGVDFVHFNGMTGDYLYPEMMGAGAAVLDYDGDGDLDLYLVQGALLGEGEPLFPPPRDRPLTDRLYRNDSPGASTPWSFADRTELMGARSSGYGMGVAAGDYDADGWPDLYVTNFGPNVLLHNEGDGTFSDVTTRSGTADGGWGVPALFLDFDRDGRLDLYTGNYVDYSVPGDRACYGTTGARDYCGPTTYPPAADRLFRNLGSGRFSEVSSRSGIGRPSRTLGAVADDFDGDGWPELYVANDGGANFLWLNRDGVFVEGALPAGVAVDRDGLAQASMGVEAADFDNDGDDDLLLTHLTGESNTLYRNEGDGRFSDESRASGLGVPSLPHTGFGVAWLDYDLDGWLDVVTLNGAVKRLESQTRRGDPYPLKQGKQLFRALGDGRFRDATAGAGPSFSTLEVGRGVAVGDLDGDGAADLLATQNSGAAQLLVNQTDSSSWIGLVLPATGARVRSENGTVALGRSHADGSYASSRDPRVILGLGGQAGPVDLLIEGVENRILFRSVPISRYLVVHR